MPEPSQTEHTHRTHSRSGKRLSGRSITSGYFEPVFYFSGAILLLVFARLIHTSLLSPIFGALGIIILAVSKIRKYKPGIILSMFCILAMAMAFAWHWVDRYAVAVLSAEISSKTMIFMNALTESLILTLMVWIYHRMLNAFYKRMGQTWIVRRSYVRFFKLLFYFIMFLSLFWIFDFIMVKAQPLTHLGIQDSAMMAGAVALLAAGIPAILYLSKGSHDEHKRQHHRQHHRHERNPQRKNSEVGEK